MSRKRVRPKDGHTYILIVNKEIWENFSKVIPEGKTKNETIVELIEYYIKIKTENSNKIKEIVKTVGIANNMKDFSDNVNTFITG